MTPMFSKLYLPLCRPPMRSKPMRVLQALLLACLVAASAVADPPDWAFDPAGWSDFMAVTGRLDLDGTAAATPGTLVGAFVEGELRGSVEVDLRFVETLGPLFFLQVWANQGGSELVTFRAYDPTADAVLPVGEALAYDANATPGTPDAPFVWSAESVGTPPAWDFDPSAFEFFMGVTGTVVIGGEPITPVSGHRVAAFVGDELRGVAEVDLGAVDPFGPLFFLQVWADEASGETVRFEVWDAVGDVVYETGETVPFTHQTTLGTVPDPFVWTAAGGPFAFDDVVTTYEDEPATIYVLANDPGSSTLTVSAVSAPANGTVTIGADGGVTYTPEPDFSGSDSFTYTVSGGSGGTATATVTVTVVAVNDAPAFESDPVTSAEAGAPYAYDIAANDVDDVALTISAPELPAWLVLTDGGGGTASLTGTPPTAGSYTVTLAVSDGELEAEQAFTVTVTGMNGAPTPGDDAAMTDEDTAVLLDVLENDGDPEDDALSIVALQETTAEGGSAELDGTSSAVLYTPPPDFFGTDSFTYTVSDGSGGTATATVTVTVSPVNDAPEFESEPVTSGRVDAPYTYVVVASDVDDTALTVSAPELPAWLALADEGDGTASLAGTPPAEGTYAVTLVVSDGELEAEQAFTVTVTGTNGAPTAADDAAETDEDAAVTIDVLENDADPDGDMLMVTAVSAPSTGTAEVGGDGGVTYTPAPDSFGTDAFNYTASDGNGGTATATVTITVAPVNDAPTPAVVTAPEDGTSIVLAGNPETPIVVVWEPSTDVEGDALTYRWKAALDGDFSAVLLAAETEETSVSTTFGVLDEALAAAGVGTGETVVVMHRVVTSDGEAETLGPQAAINVTRGVLTDSEGTVPFAFSASAVYPNPSAGRTAIMLDLPSATDVVVEVYDSAGRRVLARSEAYSAGASRRVELGSLRLSAGVYHYRVMARTYASAEREATIVRGRFAVVR